MTRRIERFDEAGKKNREKQARHRAKHAVRDWWANELAKLSRLPTPLPEHMQGTWGVYETPRAAVAAVVSDPPGEPWQRSAVLGRLYSGRDAKLLADCRDRQLKVGCDDYADYPVYSDCNGHLAGAD